MKYSGKIEYNDLKIEIAISVNSLYDSLCYSFSNLIIDPGDDWSAFKQVSYVLLTHAHLDHIYGLNDLFKRSPCAKVLTNDIGRQMLLDAKKNLSFYHETPFVFKHADNIIIINDRDEIEVAPGLVAKAIYTPGHNPSCISWIIGNAIFTGDSYIPGLKTVTNLPGGNREDAKKSEILIKKFSEGRNIYPGHKI